MSKLYPQGHAIPNIMSPPPGGLSSSQQDRDPVMPTATSMPDDTSTPHPNIQPPSYIGSKNATGVGVGGASTATSTSNSSPVAVVDAQSRDGMHRRGVNKRGPSKAGGKAGEAGTSTSAGTVTNKRRCVSNACIACRKRKSKCDGNTPSCAACSSVYGTGCVYDPSSDHRRKGVYKKDIDNLKTRNDTLQTLIQAILDHPEEQVHELVQIMRSSDNLEDVAEAVLDGKFGFAIGSTGTTGQAFTEAARGGSTDHARSESIWSVTEGEDVSMDRGDRTKSSSSDREPTLETELSQRMSQLRVDADSGQVRFIGGTSNLILLPSQVQNHDRSGQCSPNFGRELERSLSDPYLTDRERNPILSWTNVLGASTQSCEAIEHLLQMYFVWHYPYFTTLSRELFFRDFRSGYSSPVTALSPRHIPDSPSFNCYSPSPAPATQTQPMRYCTPLLFNAMLAVGCHFTAHPLARSDKNDPDTAGDHFFNECKRLILENDEHVTPRLTTVQALALMSVREAGCAREERGWSYSGMSFRMGTEMGLHLDLEGGGNDGSHLDSTSGTLRQRSIGRSRMNDEELDARRITFWGCFLFDKCWSNYMGRMPQLPSSMASVHKYIIIPSEDAEVWSPYTDVGKSMISAQPARTRAVALQIIELCEISSDVLLQFYNPNPKKPASGISSGGRATNTTGGMGMSDIRNLGVLWNRLEDWRKKLPRELEPQQGCLPSVLLMHMFHQLLYIHLFRPFLQSISATLPTLSLDPRRICVEAASKISKYLRFYKREYGLRQICNIAAYMIHSACTIHLLNLPEKSAKRDIVQGLRSLEDMAEGWLCARRALVIMRILAKRWKIGLPEEGDAILARAAKGRAEQFRLQEPDEECEFTYLDYRGSSASAVSPMSLASEPKNHSASGMDANTPDSGMQNQGGGPQVMTSNQASISGIMKAVSNRNSPGLAPSPEPREQQQIRQHHYHQQDQSQAVPGLRYHTDESAASSPGTYAPLSSFPHQVQPAFTQSQGQRQYVSIERGSSLGIQGGPASTPPPQIYPPTTSAAASRTISRLSRVPSNSSQTQYSYFENQHPPSSIASPSAFYSDTGIPIGYEQNPNEIQGGGMEQNWCIRDQELVARGFLVQGWVSGESVSRETVSGLSREGENEEGTGGGGETPWDPFTVY